MHKSHYFWDNDTPVLQTEIAFLQEHAEEYHLDMTNVIIMGQSGGAVMTAQYGAMISNPEYARLYGITPSLAPEAVKCLIIDDAPLVFDHFDRNGKRLLGNFICGTSFPSEAQKDMYDPIGYVNGTYPTAFIIGNNYHGNGYAYDMEQLYDKLTANGVECKKYDSNPGYYLGLHRGGSKLSCFESRLFALA